MANQIPAAASRNPGIILNVSLACLLSAHNDQVIRVHELQLYEG